MVQDAPTKIARLKTVALLLLFCSPLLAVPKGTVINQCNLFTHPDLFPIFKAITFLGNGWILAIVLVVLLLIRHFNNAISKQEIYEFLLVSLIMFVVVTVLKNVFFFETARPIWYFTELPQGGIPTISILSLTAYVLFPQAIPQRRQSWDFLLFNYCPVSF